MNKRPFRILLPSDSEAFHTWRLVRELRRQGCRVLVVSLERGWGTHLKLRRAGPHSLWYLLAVPQLSEVIDRFSPDIINPHFATGYGFLTALARGSRALPMALTLWGSDILLVPRKSPLHRYKAVRALDSADWVFADSQYLINEARRIRPVVSYNVVPWGVERDLLKCHKADYTFAQPLRVLVPRTQAPVYNNEFVLSALRKLVESSAITLTFPAFGPSAGSFRDACADLLEKGISLYDRLERKEYIDMVKSHDIYLSASSSDSSPASLIEAMALGLYPVVADIPGVQEWLGESNGSLFELNNQQELVKAIEEILEARNDYADIRQANLDRVKKWAIFEDNVAEQLAVMKNLAGRS